MRYCYTSTFCNVLNNILFLIGVVSYFLIKSNMFAYSSLVMNHGIDLICGYIFCYVVSLLYDLLLERKIKISFLLSIVVIASVYWEYIYPIFDSTSVSDFYDMVAYIIGFIIYIIADNYEGLVKSYLSKI